MADISKIILPDTNEEYNIKDATARSGLDNKMDKANPTGTGSLSLNRASGSTVGDNSVALGNNCEASSIYSYAEGEGATASGRASHAEGRNTTASGKYGSHAEGNNTTASGTSSHAEGDHTTTSGNYAHAEGTYTIANHQAQHVFGEYNIADTNVASASSRGDYVEIVGNGTSDNARSNARTLDWNGNETIAGDLIYNGNTSLTDKQYTKQSLNGSTIVFKPANSRPLYNVSSSIVATGGGGTVLEPIDINGSTGCTITNKFNVYKGDFRDHAKVSSSSASMVTIKFKSSFTGYIVYIPCKQNTTYIISKMLSNTFIVGMCVGSVIPTASTIYLTQFVSSPTETSITYTTDSSVNAYLCAYVYDETDTAIDPTDMLNSISIMEVAPTVISWETEAGTVYNGNIDITTGKLNSTHKLVTYDGSEDEDWVAQDGSPNVFKIVADTDSVRPDNTQATSNMATISGDTTPTTGTFRIGSSNLIINLGTFADVTAFKEFLASNNLQILYKLETPTEYDITPTVVTPILGINTMQSSCGDLTVEYASEDNSDVLTRTAKQSGIYPVFGTQTEGTNAWTGELHGVSELYDGLTIAYVLPYLNPTGNATLELTLDSGATTGPINCYRSGSRLSTQVGVSFPIIFTYFSAGSLINDGTPTTDNRWVMSAYVDTDVYAYSFRLYSVKKYIVGATGLFRYTIAMQTANGTWESIVTSSSTSRNKTMNTNGFKLDEILLYYGTVSLSSGTEISNSTLFDRYGTSYDSRYSFNVANNETNGLTIGKDVYLIGTLNSNDGLFYLDDPWWTQDLPTTEDGKLYIHVGYAYDYYRLYNTFYDKKIYRYKNGAVREYLPGTEVQDALDDALARISALETRLNEQ